jgi:hypothetical protein
MYPTIHGLIRIRVKKKIAVSAHKSTCTEMVCVTRACSIHCNYELAHGLQLILLTRKRLSPGAVPSSTSSTRDYKLFPLKTSSTGRHISTPLHNKRYAETLKKDDQDVDLCPKLHVGMEKDKLPTKSIPKAEPPRMRDYEYKREYVEEEIPFLETVTVKTENSE